MPPGWQIIRSTLLAIAVLFQAACSGKRTIDAEEARSTVRALHSLAAETELFIQVVEQGRTGRHYAAVYPAYLEDQAEELGQDLARGSPAPEAADSVRECRTELDQLSREISNMRTARGDPAALRAAGIKIRSIRQRLEKSGSQP